VYQSPAVWFRQTDLSSNGREVDDLALPAGNHAPPHFLTAEKNAFQIYSNNLVCVAFDFAPRSLS
jgi:hypothetical protein